VILQSILVYAIIAAAIFYIFFSVWKSIAKKDASPCNGCAAKELCHQKLEHPAKKDSSCCQ
jgi:hypothetical protein